MPTPTPTTTWLLVGGVLDEGVVLNEGVVLVAASEGNSPDNMDGVEDVGTMELVDRKELVVAVVVEA